MHDVLAANGVSEDRFTAVVGKSDLEPLIADDPSLSVNRRVSVLLVEESSPLPESMKP